MKPLLQVLPWVAVLLCTWAVKAALGLFVVNLLLIYVMVAVGLNLLMGFTGQVSAGQAGFLAVGAYIAALTAKFAPALGAGGALIAAGVGTAFVGLLIGMPTLRLAGFYLTMATLAFGVVVAEVILQLKGVTGGSDGLYVTVPNLFGAPLSSDESKFWLVLGCTVFTVATAQSLSRSKVGRAFLALKESPVAAEAMGINTAAYRTLAFVLSAFYTGIAGGLFAFVVAFLSPDAFTVEMSIDFAAMVIIGGMGSIWGSLLGAAFLTALNQSLASLQDARAFVFGFALVSCMIFMPLGLVGMIRKVSLTFCRASGPARFGPQT